MMAMANHSQAHLPRTIDRIIATGGASANRAILQVMANVFDADVFTLRVSNSAASARRCAPFTSIARPRHSH